MHLHQRRREPTVEEANQFAKADVEQIGGEIYRVQELSFKEASEFYDTRQVNKWPIFGQTIKHKENTVANVDSRPSWDEYFLKLAKDISLRSNCSRRKVGAIITKDKHIIATGYNGTPKGTKNCFDGGCPRCSKEHKTGEGLDECLCVHAEQNAICQSAKHGNAIDGGCIYITCSPCLTCLKLIINAGIKRVVFSEWYRKFNEQERKLIDEAGIDVEYYGK